MNEQTIKAVQEALNPLAEKLGQGAAHLYSIYVRQSAAEGIVGLVAIALLVVLWSLFAWFMKRNHAQWSKDEYSPLPEGSIAALVATAFVVLIVTFSVGSESLLKVLNPEYYAIERIIWQVKGGR